MRLSAADVRGVQTGGVERRQVNSSLRRTLCLMVVRERAEVSLRKA